MFSARWLFLVVLVYTYSVGGSRANIVSPDMHYQASAQNNAQDYSNTEGNSSPEGSGHLVRNARGYEKNNKNNYSKGFRNEYRLDEVKKQKERWSKADTVDNYKIYNNGNSAFENQAGHSADNLHNNRVKGENQDEGNGPHHEQPTIGSNYYGASNNQEADNGGGHRQNSLDHPNGQVNQSPQNPAYVYPAQPVVHQGYQAPPSRNNDNLYEQAAAPTPTTKPKKNRCLHGPSPTKPTPQKAVPFGPIVVL